MDTNGHSIPIAHPVSDTLRDLQEQVDRERLNAELASIKQTRQVMEQAGGEFGNWINPATPFFDSPDFFFPYVGENLPFNMDNRLKGELLPVYITEYGLKLLRDYSRWLAAFNPYAISALENRVSYVIGKGFGYTAVPSSRKPVFTSGDRELCRMAQAVWDEFTDRVDWGQWEQLIAHKVDVDGEAFIRFFHTGGGRVTIRPVEPEHVRSPGDQSAHLSYGIETPEYDIMDVMAYWVILNPALSVSPTRIPAEEMMHFKQDVGPSAKRGYPLLIPIRQNLARAVSLLQYMTALARAQSSIAMTRKWKQYSAQSINAWQQNNADVQSANWFSGQQRYGKQYLPGTVLDIPENVEYEFPATKIGAAALTEVLQAELRAIGARLVMPEYMISGDASNNNYASSLVSEAPSVKNFERIQSTYSRWFGDGRKGSPRHCGVWWRVMRAAVEWGLLPREVLSRVKAHVEPPMVAARDQQKDTERFKSLNESGVMSKETWSKKEGLERDREKTQIEKEQAEQPQGVPGQPGQVPGQVPGQPSQPPKPGEQPPEQSEGSPERPDGGNSGSGGIDEKHLPAMAKDAQEWIEEVFRLTGKKARLDPQQVMDALRGQMPGEQRGMVEATDSTGHEHDDAGLFTGPGQPSKADKVYAHTQRQKIYKQYGHVGYQEISLSELADDDLPDAKAAETAVKIARQNESANQDVAVTTNKHGTFTVWVGTESPTHALDITYKDGDVIFESSDGRKRIQAEDVAEQKRWITRMLGYRKRKEEACEPNKIGHGYHDSESGFPCSPNGKSTGQRQNGAGVTPPHTQGNKSPELSSIAQKTAKILSHAKGAVKRQAIRMVGKARAFAEKKFAALEAKYGRAGAIAVMSAVIAMTPVPVPGSSLAPILLAEGVRYVAQKMAGPQVAMESVSHPRRCALCGGPAIPMAAGGYRCGNPPCEWVTCTTTATS
jgi:hypothetical protein